MPYGDSETKDRQRAYAKAWREANREKINGNNRDYYKANRKKEIERNRKYRKVHPSRSPGNPDRNHLREIRRRARSRGIPFNLTMEDMQRPAVCPVLGKPMGRGLGADWAASLDRIVPERGYVKGNVVWVSMRANRIKTNATADEIRRVSEFYGPLLAGAD